MDGAQDKYRIAYGRGKTYRRVYKIPILVDGVLAHPEPRALDDDHGGVLGARLAPALELAQALELPLDAEDGLLDARGLHGVAVIGGRQPRNGPLGRAVGGVDAGAVRGLGKVLADDVDGALARLGEVVQGVFRGGGARQRGREADDEERRVVADDLEVGEGREVGRLAVGRDGRHEGDGPRDHGRDEQLVVVDRGAALGEGIDRDVLLLLLLLAGEVVCAGAELPRGRGRLREPEPFGVAVPGWARGLDFFEVWVRVALDLGLLHLEGGGGGERSVVLLSRERRRRGGGDVGGGEASEVAEGFDGCESGLHQVCRFQLTRFESRNESLFPHNFERAGEAGDTHLVTTARALSLPRPRESGALPPPPTIGSDDAILYSSSRAELAATAPAIPAAAWPWNTRPGTRVHLRLLYNAYLCYTKIIPTR